MTWRERLQPANYRGIAFGVLSSDLETGRRVTAHVYPNREEPFVEDLGRRPRTYRIEAFLVGDDYDTRRDRLIEQATKRPAGFPFRAGSILRHPYLGRVRVALTSVRVRESFQDGRMARMLLEFVEAGPAPAPDVRVSAVDVADSSAAAVADEAGEQLLADLDTKGPAGVLDVVEDKLAQLSSFLKGLDVFTGPAKEVAAQAKRIETLINQASTLATSPLDLRDAVRGAVEGIFDAAGNALSALRAYEGLFELATLVVGGSSATAKQTDRNALAIDGLVKQTAAGQAVRSAARVPWATLDDAVAARDRILAALETLELNAGDDSFQRIRALRSSLVGAVPPQNQDLPVLRVLRLPATLDSIVLAYRLYDDPERSAEIADRNRIPHPGFLPAAVPLEVLSA